MADQQQMGLVDIMLPTGEAATVPAADLQQAVAAGAHVTTEKEQVNREIGGLYGQTMTGIIGAGRVATFGLSDQILAEGANVVGGEGLRKDVLKTLSLAKETNPYSNMAGEAAGLFMPGGAGSDIMNAGAGVEGAVTSRLGEGLLGKVAGMGARGGVEGALLGVQHQVSEDTLGDHATTAEKLFAAAGKDGLIGLGAGGVLGAAGHGLGALGSAIRRGPGPFSSSILDEVAGVPGAGQALRSEAGALEGTVNDLRKAGATSEQAAKIADELQTAARARAEAGPLTGVVDGLKEAYVARRAGTNPEMRETMERGFDTAAGRLAKHAEVLDTSAQKLAEKGTAAMRGLEDTVNEVHFTERPQQMAKLVDATKRDAAADAVARMGQDVQDTLDLLNSTATKGGGDVAVKRLGKEMVDYRSKLIGLVDDAPGAVSDAFMSAYKLKQAVGKVSGFGKPPYLRTAAENEFATLYERMRTGLEDEAVWGKAGAATREWNESFSSVKGRRDDFGSRFSVAIDQRSGIPIPELDQGKVRGMLSELRGNAYDDTSQAVKSTQSVIDGFRQRALVIEKYGDLSAQQVKKLGEGRKALDEFEAEFGRARKEASVVNRLKAQQLEEQGRLFGGVAGLVGDLVTKPLTSIERLGAIRATTDRIEKTIANGIGRFFDGKGADIVARVTRPSADVAKDIGAVKALAANPAAMQERASKLVGDLVSFAPKVAGSVATLTQRALTFLAQEAPQATVPVGIIALHKVTPRYSDQALSVWESKREAVFHPETVVDEMRRGRLNRDGIRAVEFVYPQMFAQMQQIAREQIARLDTEGKLKGMPYEQRAVISTLLKIPADGTWQGDFIAMMQAAKAQPMQPQQSIAPQPQGGSKRAIKLDTHVFATEAETIERAA